MDSPFSPLRKFNLHKQKHCKMLDVDIYAKFKIDAFQYVNFDPKNIKISAFL